MEVPKPSQITLAQSSQVIIKVSASGEYWELRLVALSSGLLSRVLSNAMGAKEDLVARQEPLNIRKIAISKKEVAADNRWLATHLIHLVLLPSIDADSRTSELS
jgi:hypothetical protein